MKCENWTSIRDEISQGICFGRMLSGDELPTETQLAERFEIGRHSNRRAPEALARDGGISIEQGRCTLAASTPGLKPPRGHAGSQLILASKIAAPDHVARALLPHGNSLVTEGQRLTLVNDLPMAFDSIRHCPECLPDFAAQCDVLGSAAETYWSFGIGDYVQLLPPVCYRSAKSDEIKTLKQHYDVPVMVVSAIDATLDGASTSTSRVIWSAARGTFTMEQSDG